MLQNPPIIISPNKLVKPLAKGALLIDRIVSETIKEHGIEAPQELVHTVEGVIARWLMSYVQSKPNHCEALGFFGKTSQEGPIWEHRRLTNGLNNTLSWTLPYLTLIAVVVAAAPMGANN